MSGGSTTQGRAPGLSYDGCSAARLTLANHTTARRFMVLVQRTRQVGGATTPLVPGAPLHYALRVLDPGTILQLPVAPLPPAAGAPAAGAYPWSATIEAAEAAHLHLTYAELSRQEGTAEDVAATLSTALATGGTAAGDGAALAAALQPLLAAGTQSMNTLTAGCAGCGTAATSAAGPGAAAQALGSGWKAVLSGGVRSPDSDPDQSTALQLAFAEPAPTVAYARLRTAAQLRATALNTLGGVLLGLLFVVLLVAGLWVAALYHRVHRLELQHVASGNHAAAAYGMDSMNVSALLERHRMRSVRAVVAHGGHAAAATDGHLDPMLTAAAAGASRDHHAATGASHHHNHHHHHHTATAPLGGGDASSSFDGFDW